MSPISMAVLLASVVRRAGGAASAGSGNRSSPAAAGAAEPLSPIEPLMTTGLVLTVNASSTTASSMAVRPSRRYCGLKPVVMSSPLMVASIDSVAWASSPEPASRVRVPSLNASWTAVLRSATRATRLTDSISEALSTVAVVWCSLGNRLRTLGNSPSSSRVVVRRVPPAAGALEADDALAAAAGGQRDGDLAARGQRLGGVAEHLRRDERGQRTRRGCGVPARARGGRAGTGRWPASRSSTPSRSRSGRR